MSTVACAQDAWGRAQWLWDRPPLKRLRLTISMAQWTVRLPALLALVASQARATALLACRLTPELSHAPAWSVGMQAARRVVRGIGRSAHPPLACRQRRCKGRYQGKRQIAVCLLLGPNAEVHCWSTAQCSVQILLCSPVVAALRSRHMHLPVLTHGRMHLQVGLLATQVSLPMLAPLLLGTGMLLRSIRTNASFLLPRIGLLVVMLWLLWFANSVVQNTVVYLRRQARPPPRCAVFWARKLYCDPPLPVSLAEGLEDPSFTP